MPNGVPHLHESGCFFSRRLMADVVDRATRSRMMSGIRGRNTKPEVTVRKYLHSQGLRYRIAPKNLPGKPDIVLPKYHVVVFVHGCFWHRHPRCKYAAVPSSNARFWKKKFAENVTRDKRVHRALRSADWRIIVIWECQIGAPRLKRLYEQIVR